MIADATNNGNALWRYIERHRPAIEVALRDHLPLAPDAVDTRFNEAVEYSAFPGGKRLRPILTLLGAELCGGSAGDVLEAATAVEFIHTSSLIFDDLPAMDDSEERRGKLSLHKKYGEGLSTLVAIGFLNQAYALAARSARDDRRRSADAVLEIVDCVGPAGMIGGQSVDLKLREIVACRICSARIAGGVLNLKTSSLIRLALRLGGIHSGASERDLDRLSQFAELLGQAYQISDDIIDVAQDVTVDGAGHRVDLEGSPSARLASATESAKGILNDNFSPCEARDHLIELVDYVSQRKE
ncbi:MAG: polyprenyl synthetase family protein [Pyrinomonadaceae bacterium]